MLHIKLLPAIDLLSALFDSRTFEELSHLKDESTVLMWIFLFPLRTFELLDH